MAKSHHNSKLRLSGYLPDLCKEPLEVEFEPVCPKNGWSMNEIWKHAHLELAFFQKSGPLRHRYDYGEPAGFPVQGKPHSTIPGDWEVTEDGKIVSYMSQRPGQSAVRQETEKK